MTSLYRGYTIDHDRNHAHAWRGKQEQREPDVIAQDLAGAIHHIDVELEDERRRVDDWIEAI